MIPKEAQELRSTELASIQQNQAGNNESIAAVIHAIPDFNIHTQPFGLGITLGYGSANIAAIFTAFARDAQNLAALHSQDAALSSRLAGYIRREQESTFAANTAIHEIKQIDKQLAAADLRIQIAEKELENHKKQIENSQEIEDFMVNKDSNFLNYQALSPNLHVFIKNFTTWHCFMHGALNKPTPLKNLKTLLTILRLTMLMTLWDLQRLETSCY